MLVEECKFWFESSHTHTYPVALINFIKRTTMDSWYRSLTDNESPDITVEFELYTPEHIYGDDMYEIIVRIDGVFSLGTCGAKRYIETISGWSKYGLGTW